MKKILSILAMLLISGVSFAQTFTVKVGEYEVKNGETVELGFDTCPVEWIVPGVIGVYEIDPDIKIVTSEDQQITITVSDEVKDGILQVCSFGKCVPLTEAANPYTVTGTVNAGETPADVHFSFGSSKPTDNFERSFNMEVSNGAMTISFAVHCGVGTYSAINNVMLNSVNAAAFNLSGSKVNANTLPNGAIYIKGGKKYIKK